MTTPHSRIGFTTAALSAFAFALLHASGGSPVFGSGETIVVTTVDDIVDSPTPQQIGGLPGPDGRVSFREAVETANNTPGPQTITFAIPASEFWLMPELALLRNEGDPFFLTDDGTSVDFTTQTAFTGDTNPNGNEVGIFGLHPGFLGIAAIYITANNCVIKGLDTVRQRGYGVEISGNNNRVIGSTINGPMYAAVYISGGFGGPASTGNIVGGTAPGEGNVLSSGSAGVRIDGPAEGNIVIGNFLTGVEVRSATCCPGLVAINNRIGGPTAAERNIISGVGGIGEEGFPNGTQVSLEWAVGTIVEGNYVGTTIDGNAAYPNQRGPGGVSLTNSTGSIIRNNLISGIAVDGVNHYFGQRFGVGISLAGNNAGTIIEGNRIGTNAAGTAAVPNHNGITASFWPGTPASGGVRIGGTLPGQANTIAFNETTGILVQAVVTRVEISGNSIHSNAGLGIDLMTFGSVPGALGVTLNDLGDGDDGGNGLQNYPVLTSAASSGSSIETAGTFNSSASGQFRLEFFGNSVCDPTGFGEGRTFLGSATVTTNASGNAAFDVTFPAASTVSTFITAAAISLATGDTSEFSACVPISVAPVTGDLNGDGHVNTLDLGILLSSWSIPLTAPGCSGSKSCPSDMNGDGFVNSLDLGILLTHWG